MIKLFNVHMPDDAGQALSEVLYSGHIAQGPKVIEFEKLFAKYIGNPNVASVSSCTAGLSMSLILAGVKPGDEVIATPMTCMASNMPIFSMGAKIVWADIDSHTGNIDPLSIRDKITSKTKAILYVHWGGQPADIENINKIALNHGIKTIEDAAHSLGAKYDGKQIGNHGDFVCFSFQAIKHITTGDGGMVAVQNKDDLNRLIRMRWYGLDRRINESVTKWKEDIIEVGFKANMNDLQASLGVSQMRHVSSIVSKHMENSVYYDKQLESINGITTVDRNLKSKTSSWIYTLLLDTEKERDRFSRHMKENGIDCSVVHVRNDEYSIFSEFKSHLPGVDRFCSRMINIPCGWWVSEEDREHIVGTIKKGW